MNRFFSAMRGSFGVGLMASLGCMSFTGCPPLGDVMRVYGYTELKPPSNLLQPGAVVYVLKQNPFVAGIICGARASLGAGWQPSFSPTATADLSKVEGMRFKLGAPILKLLQADARFEAVHTVSVALSNPQLFELDDTAVLENVAHRSQACHAAIRARLAQGYKVSMVSSGLKGDVKYSVRWKDGVDLGASAKVAALGDLAIELGGGATHVGDDMIAATGLIWGIKDDAYLAALSVPDLDESNVSRGTSIIPAEVTAHLVTIPDAPVVKPMAAQPSAGSFKPASDANAQCDGAPKGP